MSRPLCPWCGARQGTAAALREAGLGSARECWSCAQPLAWADDPVRAVRACCAVCDLRVPLLRRAYPVRLWDDSEGLACRACYEYGTGQAPDESLAVELR